MTATHRPKVLMLTTQLGYGGSESDFLRLAEFLAHKTDTTIALFSRDYGSDVYSAAQPHTDISTVILDDYPRPDRGAWSKARKWLRLRRKLEQLKRQHEVSISFLSGPNLLNVVTGKPGTAIVSERGSKMHHVGLSPARKWLYLKIVDPFIYRRAGGIVPASIGYAQEINEIAGARQRHKIVAIEGSIISKILYEKTDAPLDDDIARFCINQTAVFCGRLDRGKGIDLILPTFACVRRKLVDARLLVIGDGPLFGSLHNRCADLNLSVTMDGDSSADVFLAGYRRDPVRHFRVCRAFLFPSLHEGLSNSLIEGVASGVPVLAADCPWGSRSILSGPADPGLPDKINNPVPLTHGTLMPIPDTPEALAAWEGELLKLLQYSPDRRSAGERLAAIARFDIEVTGRQWLQLIERIIACQSPHDNSAGRGEAATR